MRRFLHFVVGLVAALAVDGVDLRGQVLVAATEFNGSRLQTIAPRLDLDAKAMLDVSDVPLQVALRKLHLSSGVPLLYSPTFLPHDHRVICRCESVSVRDALSTVLSETDLTFAVSAGQVVVVPEERQPVPSPPSSSAALRAEKTSGLSLPTSGLLMRPLSPLRSRRSRVGTLTGQVVDPRTLQPLSAVQVSIPALGLGALTAANGRYLLTNVPAGTHEVRAQRIGYQSVTQTVEVRDDQTTEVNFALVEQAIGLDELVVTGTAGATQRRAIGNAIARIDAAETVELSPVTNMADLLTARTPGVLVTPGSGTAGSGSRIKIRGSASLTLDTQPLVYVDGVRVDNAIATGPGSGFTSRLNDFNPEDIESIEIIKGPAAATLYGTEAASGVIQIITKKGRSGELDIGLSIRQGAAWLGNPEGRFPTNWYRGPETGNELRSLNGAVAETERGDPIFRTGHMQSYMLSVAGGGDQYQFYAAGNFDRDEGVEEPNVSKRYSGRINLSIAPHPTIDVSTNIGLNIIRSDLVPQLSPTNSVVGATKRANPRQLAVNPASRGFFARPPEVIWAVSHLLQEVNRTTTSLVLNHRPWGWLTQRFTIGGDFVHENNEDLTPFMSPELAQFYSASAAAGSKSVNQRDVTNTTVDYGATANVPITDAIISRTSVGAQYYRKFLQIFQATGEQFPGPGVSTVAAAAIRSGSDDFVENTTVGTYIQQELSLNNRLFLTAAVRADDNSAFGRDFDVQIYPKISGSWVLSEEPFWSYDFVNTLRLRGAFGASGQQPDAFAAIRTFAPVTGTGDGPAATPQSLGNPALGPERGEELEVGFETGLLNDRVGLDFTFYHQKTRDAILLAPVAPSSGFPGSRFVNAGEIQNQGMELLFTARPVDREAVDWDLSLNLSTNDSEILSLGGLPPIGTTGTSPGGPSAEHREGYPPWSFFVKRVVSAGFDGEGTATDVLCDGGPENNNQPMPCEDAPRVFVGKLEPDWQGSVSSGLTLFNRIRIQGLFDFQMGRENFAEDTWVRCSIYRVCLENFEPTQFDARRIAEVERAGSEPVRSIYYNDASFIKLRELSLNYAVSPAMARTFGASRASITLAGRNLSTWTDWPQLDPESTRLALVGGFDQAQVPPLAQFVATINVSF